MDESLRVVLQSECRFRSRKSPGFDLSILTPSGILGAADKAVLTFLNKK
jgi:hypothetical protein